MPGVQHRSIRIRHIVGAVALVLLTWAAVVVARAYTARPSPKINYAAKADELILAAQPPGDNAWPLYKSLLDDIGAFDESNPLRRIDKDALLLSGDWSDERLKAPLAEIVPFRRWLPRLDEAAEAPGYHFAYADGGAGGPMYEVLLPQLSPLRRLAHLNAIEMRAAAEAQDWDAVERRLRTGLTMGRHQSYQLTIIEWLVGVSMYHLALTEVRRLALEHDLPAEVADRLAATIAEIRWPAGNPGGWLDGEYFFQCDFVQWCYTDDGNGDGRAITWVMDRFMNTGGALDARPSAVERMGNVASIIMPGRAETQALLDEWRDSGMTMLDATEAEIDAWMDELMTRAGPRSMLTYTMPAISRAALSLQRVRREAAGAGAVLRLESFYAHKGRWPGSLGEAMPEDATLDPISGEPMQYAPRTPTPDDPRPYFLSSPDELQSVSNLFELRAPLREPEPEDPGLP